MLELVQNKGVATMVSALRFRVGWTSACNNERTDALDLLTQNKWVSGTHHEHSYVKFGDSS